MSSSDRAPQVPLTEGGRIDFGRKVYDDDAPDVPLGMSEEDLQAFIQAGRESAAVKVGRPSLTESGQHSPRLSFRVPVQVRDQLEELARRDGVDVSVVARAAIDEFLTNHA